MTPIDLTPFVSKDETRPEIYRPFSIGDWTYATDGRVLVRVPRREQVPEYEDSPKSAQDYFIASVQPWIELPEFDEYPLEALALEKDCEACSGSGWTTCETCGHDDRCDYCDGDGVINKPPEPKPVLVGGAFFSQLYLTLIKRLPSVRFGLPHHDTQPARFIFNGGEGVVQRMGRKP